MVWEILKKLKFLDYILLIGVMIFIFITKFDDGLLLPMIVLNIISFSLCILYLMKYKRSQKFIDESILLNFRLPAILGICGFGLGVGIFYIIKFHRYPLTIDITKEQLDNNIESEKKRIGREKRLKKLLDK